MATAEPVPLSPVQTYSKDSLVAHPDGRPPEDTRPVYDASGYTISQNSSPLHPALKARQRDHGALDQDKPLPPRPPPPPLPGRDTNSPYRDAPSPRPPPPPDPPESTPPASQPPTPPSKQQKYTGVAVRSRDPPPPPPPPPNPSRRRDGDSSSSDTESSKSSLWDEGQHAHLSNADASPPSPPGKQIVTDSAPRGSFPPPPPPPPAAGKHIATKHVPRISFPPPPPPPPPSSSLSATQDDKTSSSSEYDESTSGDEDEYDHENRNFPPLMPTVQSRQAFARKRAVITKRITHRVFRYEHVKRSASNVSEPESRSNGSSTDPEVDGVQVLWIQLKEMRKKLNETKREMAKRRRDLRELRRRKDEADNAFMNLLRPILVRTRRSPTSDEMLDKRFAEMQGLRTEYHWLESSYEGLEVALDEEEADLNKLETRFFSMLAAGRTRSARGAPRERKYDYDREEERLDLPEELLGISSSGPSEDTHPLYKELVSAIGDLGIAKEAIDELTLQREQILHEIGLKENAGRRATKEEIEFMKEFPAEEREKRENVKQLSAEVARLKRLCVEQGVMKKHLSFKDAHYLYPDDMAGDIGEDMSVDGYPELRTLANPQFPELLSQPDYVLRPELLTPHGDWKQAAKLPKDDATKEERMNIAVKEYGIEHLISEFESEDKSDYVTRWLLYQLRTSPLAAELLHTTFEEQTRFKIKDTRQWQEDVLFYWWKDDAVKQKEHITGPLTSMDDLGLDFAKRWSSSSFARRRSPTASKAASDHLEDYRRRHHYSDDGTKTIG